MTLWTYAVPYDTMDLPCTRPHTGFTLYHMTLWTYAVPYDTMDLPCTRPHTGFTLYHMTLWTFAVPYDTQDLPCTRPHTGFTLYHMTPWTFILYLMAPCTYPVPDGTFLLLCLSLRGHHERGPQRRHCALTDRRL